MCLSSSSEVLSDWVSGETVNTLLPVDDATGKRSGCKYKDCVRPMSIFVLPSRCNVE